MAKATKQEMLEREAFINDLIARGEAKDTIIKEVAKKYKIANSSAERQYYQLLKTKSAQLMEHRELIRMELDSQLQDIHRSAKRQGLNKVAIEAINSRAKLLGLNEKVEKVEKRPDTIIFKEEDMGKKLEVVPKIDKANGDE